MDLDIKQCRVCGKLFQTFGNPICMDCLDEKENSFLLVRDYIYANPKAGIVEICEKTGVRERWIMDFLREERLSLVTNDAVLTCERCGKPILTGRFCKECMSALQKVFSADAANRSSSGKDRLDGDSKGRTGSRESANSRGFSKTSDMHLNFRER